MPTLKVIHQNNEVINAQVGCRKYHDGSALDTVIAYCLQDCKVPSKLVGSYGVNINQAAFEMHRLAQAFGKDNGLRLRHMILSFSDQELKAMRSRAPEYVYRIADYAARYYGGEYQIIYAVHEDTGRLHAHLVMNTVNYKTGLKYRGDKKDYYVFQNYLGSFLWNQYGMELQVVPDREVAPPHLVTGPDLRLDSIRNK